MDSSSGFCPHRLERSLTLASKGVPNGRHKWTERDHQRDGACRVEHAQCQRLYRKRFPKTGGWGYAVFNYDAASGKFTADPKSLADCGNSCHVAVKAKDYIFHPYEKR